MRQYFMVNGVRFDKDLSDIIEGFTQEWPVHDHRYIRKKFGVAQSTQLKLARALNLNKSPEYIKRIQEEGIKRAQYKLKITGKYQVQNLRRTPVFTKEWNWWSHATEEQKAVVRKKIGQRKHEIYEAERRRVKWGLPQQTHLVVISVSANKRSAQNRLRKAGYVEVEKHMFMRPTDKHVKMERNMEKKYNFKFIDKIEENEAERPYNN